MEVVKATAGDLDLAEWSMDVPLDLGALAGETLLSPGVNLLVQAVPDELGGHQVAGGVDSRVREVVDGVKHLAAPGCWHHGALAASGGIAQERVAGRAKWEVLEAQVGDRRAVSVDLRVCLLGLCHLLEVEPILDSTDDGTRECISHRVVFAGDVLQVGGVL